MDERLEHAPVGVLEITPERAVKAANSRACSVLGVDDPAGEPIRSVVPRSVDDTLLEACGGDSVTESDFEEYYPDLERWLSVSVVPTGAGGVVYLRDVTETRRNEATLERLREQQARTAVIDDVLADVLAELVETSSREEIADVITDGLEAIDRYEFAWVGERTLVGEGLDVRGSAGDTGDTFAAVRAALDESATTPEERAVETGDIQVVQPLAESRRLPDEVRVAAFSDGIQSVLAVPLTTGSSVHGVLGVYGTSEAGFSEREQSSFATLGAVAGFAVTAARNRQLLRSDRVTEVTFDVGGSSAVAALSVAFGTSVELNGLAPGDEDSVVCYLVLEGAVEDVTELARDVGGVVDVRSTSAGDASGTLAVTIRDEADPLVAAASLGATVRRASFEDGNGRVTVEFPPGSDVRRMATLVTRASGADVIAKRECERTSTAAPEFRADVQDRLTDRQRDVLKAAYHANYFESPRGSTAEEVASSLGIADSTLLYHLRASQRQLLDAFFGESGGSER
jgi:predicted DNA binding protein